MSTETTPDKTAAPPPAATAAPKKIVNAQTVCNERNEKKKLCNGHLKQLRTGGEDALKHLKGDDALFKCQTCGTLYMGPPLGHVRDPDKQARFVERELAALLQAAGGTLPAIIKNEKGAYVLAGESAPHAPAAAKPATAKAAPAAQAPAAGKAETPAKAAKAGHSIKVGAIPGANGPVPGETFEQKIVRLKGVAAEAKRRREAREAAEAAGETMPDAASTSGTDSSAEADRHRPAAEAQAATGMASAVPLSAASATASPAAGAETPEDLAPDAVAATSNIASVNPVPIPGADGPVPGETFEQKIERLKGVAAAARERAIREGRRSE
ncbi:MAG TPA: hypothetical protein VGC91_13405 [Pyrinomonadaceae bacterium]|jgi:hypothetical protein